MRLKQAYFIASGIFAHVFVLILFVMLAKHFDLSPRQFVYRLFEKSGIENQTVAELSLNTSFQEKYAPIVFRPKLKADATLLPQISLLQQQKLPIEKLLSASNNPYKPCVFSGLNWDTSCYLATKHQKLEPVLTQQLLSFELNTPNASGHHGNGWELGFLYLATKHTLPLTDEQRSRINAKLNKAVYHYLLLLNDTSPSLWHGRASLIAQMWLSLVALDNPPEELIERVSAHFYVLVEAIETTEAWPEGYSYWINSRAFNIVLALGAYLQLTEEDHWHARVEHTLNRIGLWHIYATRPDNSIEPLGDEGPRLDLKDETRRVIDIIAQLTDNPIFYQYSHKLEDIHGRESYYRGYRWGHTLFNAWYKPRSLTNYLALIQTSEVFGLPYFGQAYIRQGWQDSSSFITFRAGDSFTHHGHYDNGHLTLFKGAPLLLNSSLYQGFTSKNRLDYSIRTIAKNSVIINDPDSAEIDGGQRVTLPTGSSIFSVSHWFENRNKNQMLAGGEIASFQVEPTFTYLKADITRAYHTQWSNTSDKPQVKLAQRELVYLKDDDILLVKDAVTTANKQQQASLVYHTQFKPFIDEQRVVEGNLTNGIMKSNSRVIKVKNDRGHLVTEVFGDVADITLTGGKDYAFYVAGENKDDTIGDTEKNKAAQWRFAINLMPSADTMQAFTVHRPNLDDYSLKRTKKHKLANGSTWLQLNRTALTFDDIPANELLSLTDIDRVIICPSSDKSTSPCEFVVYTQEEVM